MKKIVLMLTLCMLMISIYAQSLTTATKYGSNGAKATVITPTIDNLVALVEMSESRFVSTLKSYGYFSDGEPVTDCISYWNASLDNLAYVKATNTFLYSLVRDEIRCIIPKDMIYPSSAVADLYRSLRSYNKGFKQFTDCTINRYEVPRNGRTYSIYIAEYSTSVMVQCLK